MPKGKFTPFTKAQERKIKREYLKKPVKRLADETGASFGRIMNFLKKHNLTIPPEIVEQRKKASQFNKGHVSHNKGKKQTSYMRPEMIAKTKATRFKKGSLPHNYKGGEFLSKEGYIMLSLGNGKQRLKHLHLWEQRHGKVKKGYCLACLSKDITNCDPSNWELITRAENMLRNSRHNHPPQVIKTMAIRSLVLKKIKQIQENGSTTH